MTSSSVTAPGALRKEPSSSITSLVLAVAGTLAEGKDTSFFTCRLAWSSCSCCGATWLGAHPIGAKV